ncbi:MAG: PilN domain-containing protein [Deltaproteobacteria bacterium]|nr:PilN domain-containing protein [Deltaproteobacteria bacterium]
MIKVNLFPFRAARIKEDIRRQVGVYLLSVIFLVLLLGPFPFHPYSYFSLNKEVKSLRTDRDVKQKELDSFKDTNIKIVALKKTIADVEVKLKTIQRLEKGKTGPVKLLDDIAMSVPEDKLWLTTLKEQKGTLILDGTAMDNETVADFMDRLQNTKSINSVQLVRTRQKKIPGFDLSVKDFSLNSKTYAFREKILPKAGKKK